jgi:hypothetical protein
MILMILLNPSTNTFFNWRTSPPLRQRDPERHVHMARIARRLVIPLQRSTRSNLR